MAKLAETQQATGFTCKASFGIMDNVAQSSKQEVGPLSLMTSSVVEAGCNKGVENLSSDISVHSSSTSL